MLNSMVERIGRMAGAPLVAIGFLTVLPLPLPTALAMGPMGWPVAAFPLAGAGIGALLALLNLALGPWVPGGLLVALLLAALMAITGALHLDGLMDTFDGLFGGKAPEGRVAIMRDSRVGSFGVAAAITMLLVEYSALQSLPLQQRTGPLIAALCLSRWAMAVTIWLFPPASNRGLAAGLKPAIRWWHVATATLLAVAITAWSLGVGSLAVLVAPVATLLLLGWLALRRIGGITGDICGAVGELSEVSTLVVGTILAGL
ncbi:MAG TPA: adenosylcobinamide-GDP ribazoletransferase [Chloroflexota bacterium]|nr:adenosylcobinamide-GDP ribazoletransferase [Chloroflexota bacterium]